MSLKSKFSILAGSILIAGGVLTGAVFAAEAPEAAAQPTQAEQSAKAGKVSAGQKEVLQQLSALRKSAMEKLQADSKAIVDQALAEGKITQEQADRLLKHGRGHGPALFPGKGLMGHGRKHGFFPGGHFKGLTQEELKTKLDKAVEAGKLTREQADKLLERFEEKAGKTEG